MLPGDSQRRSEGRVDGGISAVGEFWPAWVPARTGGSQASRIGVVVIFLALPGFLAHALWTKADRHNCFISALVLSHEVYGDADDQSLQQSRICS